MDRRSESTLIEPPVAPADVLDLADRVPSRDELNRQLTDAMRRVAVIRSLLRVARVRDSYSPRRARAEVAQ